MLFWSSSLSITIYLFKDLDISLWLVILEFKFVGNFLYFSKI